MRKQKFALSLLFILSLSFNLFAQSTEIKAVLAFVDGYYEDISIVTLNGEQLEVEEGMEIPLGSSITTLAGTAVEIELLNNGTIFRVAENTTFEIEDYQGRQGSDSTVITLLQGAIRTVAAKAEMGLNYTIRTPSAVCGIRGTDIITEESATGSAVYCKEGSVEVRDADGSSQPVLIGANEMIDTSKATLESKPLSANQIRRQFDNRLGFVSLNPANVPTVTRLASNDRDTTTEESGDQSTEDSNQDDSSSPVTGESTDTSEDETSDRSAPIVDVNTPQSSSDFIQEKEEADSQEDVEIADWLSDLLAFEIGYVNLNGESWAKLIAQPEINAGSFHMGLYLPIIYKDNIVDFSEWYTPVGNNEWSFGFDQTNFWYGMGDFLGDIFLKIKYIEYGDPLWDNFYFKVGNLETMTLGHGILINNYTNYNNFPAERKIGINTGMTFGGFKLEMLMDNAAAPSLVGTRLAFKFNKEKSFALGVTLLADLFPAQEATDPAVYGNAMLFGVGIDFDIFKINKDNFKMLGYADLAIYMPWFLDDPTKSGSSITAGGGWGYIWDSYGPHNFGIVAGIQGEISIVDYKVELRYYNGTFTPSLFDNIYDQNKIKYIDEMMDSIDNPSAVDHTLGLYADVGFGLLKDQLVFNAAYYMPWNIGGNSIGYDIHGDYLKAEVLVFEDLIPKYALSGSITYERTNFVGGLVDGDFAFFDADTTFSGRITAPLAKTLDLALAFSTSIKYDSNGNIVYSSDGVTPQMVPIITVETQIHF